MGFSVWELLLFLLVVVLLFGTKRFRTIGSDLGAALKGFKKEMNSDDVQKNEKDADFAQVDEKAPQSTHSTQKSTQHND